MLTKEQLQAFETDICETFCRGEIRAPVHLSDGNEDQLIEVFGRIRPQDWVFSTWRSHYHALLRGLPPEFVRQKILDGHSISINCPEKRFFASAIVGGIVPIAMGVAMGIRLRGADEKAYLFIGDMTDRIGIVHEMRQFSEGNSLPICIVVEDNGVAVSTPTADAWGTDGAKLETVRYEYRSRFPHVGAGKWLTF